MTARSRWWVVLVAALIGAALTARLGFWQLDRGAQKTALQSSLDSRSMLPPIAPEALAKDDATAVSQVHRAVRLQGQWLVDATVYLDNRQMHGRPGFFVLTPLMLPDGSAVVVQRGWVPRHVLDRTLVPEVRTPGGTVVVEGVIAPPPARLYEFGEDPPGRIRQNLDLPAFSLQIGKPLRPVSIYESPTSPVQDDGLLRDWPRPAVDVHKHHGYAFQWFGLSALITGLYVWFQLIRPRRQGR